VAGAHPVAVNARRSPTECGTSWVLDRGHAGCWMRTSEKAPFYTVECITLSRERQGAPSGIIRSSSKALRKGATT
jgi:hypothetical protein